MSTHIVLVPGFAGFDTLGQLEYYAGVTPLFRAWLDRHPGDAASLLYFDNFPTAAVRTRAARLQRFLARRLARGEFQPGDRVALVGHSTGGLDIRWLLRELGSSSEAVTVDGGAAVEPARILDLVKSVVFLSVPQWGTNIADWVTSHDIGRRVVTAELRAVVAVSQVPLLDKLQDLLARVAGWITDSDLLLAAQDALLEAEVDTGTSDPVRIAQAQQAAADLALWLRHMAADFSVIDDLTSEVPRSGPASPAHFSPAERAAEQAIWRSHGIRTKSYATVGSRPFRFDPDDLAPPWDLLKPWTYPDASKAGEDSPHTDIVYRAAYRACAGGPFRFPPGSDVPPTATLLGSNTPRRLAVWDNDGIVNTASMLWPDGAATALVEGDHEDIVGHFRRVESIPGSGRRFQAYDLLRSGTPFQSAFEQVWNGVFDFCL